MQCGWDCRHRHRHNPCRAWGRRVTVRLRVLVPRRSHVSAGEVTASGAGRLCDEQNFVRSAAVGCITVSSGAGKTEIPVKLTASEARSCGYPTLLGGGRGLCVDFFPHALVFGESGR